MVMGLAPARYDSLSQALSVRVAHRESVRLARPRLFPYGLAHQATSAADPDIKHSSGYGWPTNKAREYPRLAGYQICKIQYVPGLNLYPVRSIASETTPGVNRNYDVHIT